MDQGTEETMITQTPMILMNNDEFPYRMLSSYVLQRYTYWGSLAYLTEKPDLREVGSRQIGAVEYIHINRSSVPGPGRRKIR
jgi:hypothetical protein